MSRAPISSRSELLIYCYSLLLCAVFINAVPNFVRYHVGSQNLAWLFGKNLLPPPCG